MMVVAGMLVVLAVVLVLLVVALVVFIDKGGAERIGLPEPWKAFAAQNHGSYGDGEVRFRTEGGRVSLYHGSFRAKDSERMHGLMPGDYTVMSRTLERNAPEYRGEAELELSGLPAGVHGMISGRVARVCLPGLVLDVGVLERALSALGALEREG